MAEETTGDRVRTLLAERGWKQSDLARESGIDKNTISDLVGNRRTPTVGTLARVEQALGLTPGTLTASGEDAPALVPLRPAGGPTLREASEEELISELSYRVGSLKRRFADAMEMLSRDEDQDPAGDLAPAQSAADVIAGLDVVREARLRRLRGDSGERVRMAAYLDEEGRAAYHKGER